MPKYDFSIATRDGQKVESIQIYGKDLADAERKLYQMYHYCKILQCRVLNTEKEFTQSADIEDLLTLISKYS